MNERGTYCIVIDRQLITRSCPLPKGTCMWKHRVHGLCMYSEEFALSTFSANEYAARVGLPIVDPDIVNILKRVLVSRVKEELAN